MLWNFILNKLCCPVQILGVRYGLQVFCFMVNLIKWVIEVTFNWNLAWWYHRSLDKIPFVNYSFILYIVCLSISLPGTLLHKIKIFFSDYYLVYLRGIYVKTRNSFVLIFCKFADFLLFQPHDFLNQPK